tara:strand:- start:1277 stop:1462 length:186 start_codon:yes stop_codon:yes gene_type:complete
MKKIASFWNFFQMNIFDLDLYFLNGYFSTVTLLIASDWTELHEALIMGRSAGNISLEKTSN